MNKVNQLGLSWSAQSSDIVHQTCHFIQDKLEAPIFVWNIPFSKCWKLFCFSFLWRNNINLEKYYTISKFKKKQTENTSVTWMQSRNRKVSAPQKPHSPPFHLGPLQTVQNSILANTHFNWKTKRERRKRRKWRERGEEGTEEKEEKEEGGEEKQEGWGGSPCEQNISYFQASSYQSDFLVIPMPFLSSYYGAREFETRARPSACSLIFLDFSGPDSFKRSSKNGHFLAYSVCWSYLRY